MKSFSILMICLAGLFGSFHAAGQITIQKFCSVSMIQKSFKGTRAQISFGSKGSPMSIDSSIIYRLQKVNEFNNMVDVMNFMTAEGWEFLSILIAGDNNPLQERVYFKKDFDKTELKNEK